MKKARILVALVAWVALAALLVGALVAWFASGERVRDDVLTLYGNVDVRQVALAFDGSGRVTELALEEGARVVAGEVLARLDTTALVLQARAAQAQVAVARQTLLRLQNGARAQELAQAASQVVAAQAEAAQAGRDLARLQTLATQTQGRGVTVQELERAQSAVVVARARAAEQQAARQLLQNGARAEDIAATEAQVRVGEAQLALLCHQIAQGTLRAPRDAVVRARLVEVGDMTNPQRPVYTLVLTTPKWLRVWVSEAELGWLRPGMAAQVFTDSHPDAPIDGTVGFIASVAEFTPQSVQTEELRSALVYEVRVGVADPQDRLRLGMPATVRIARAP